MAIDNDSPHLEEFLTVLAGHEREARAQAQLLRDDWRDAGEIVASIEPGIAIGLMLRATVLCDHAARRDIVWTVTRTDLDTIQCRECANDPTEAHGPPDVANRRCTICNEPAGELARFAEVASTIEQLNLIAGVDLLWPRPSIVVGWTCRSHGNWEPS